MKLLLRIMEYRLKKLLQSIKNIIIWLVSNATNMRNNLVIINSHNN